MWNSGHSPPSWGHPTVYQLFTRPHSLPRRNGPSHLPPSLSQHPQSSLQGFSNFCSSARLLSRGQGPDSSSEERSTSDSLKKKKMDG